MNFEFAVCALLCSCKLQTMWLFTSGTKRAMSDFFIARLGSLIAAALGSSNICMNASPAETRHPKLIAQGVIQCQPQAILLDTSYSGS